MKTLHLIISTHPEKNIQKDSLYTLRAKYQHYMKNFNFLLLLLLISLPTVHAQNFVINMTGYNMSFIESNRTVLVDAGNGGKMPGSVHRYDNLISKDGLTIYGKLTVLETKDAYISTYFDYDNPDNGLPSRFQPYITTTAPNGYVLSIVR